MGANWSALGLRGGNGGGNGGGGNLAAGGLCATELAPEDEQMLFHPRKRRPSDVSMQTVLHEPVVSDAFRDFMHEKLSESLVSLWIDLYAYERISYESDFKRARAQEIFAKYFAEHAPLGAVCNDFLDAATQRDLRARLNADPATGTVRQRDPRSLGAAFKLTYAKLVTYLKFEFMPQFLVSKHFGRLGTTCDESFWAELEASEGPDAETVLRHPWLLSYFSDFISSLAFQDHADSLDGISSPFCKKGPDEPSAHALAGSIRKAKAESDASNRTGGGHPDAVDDDLLDGGAGDEDDAEYAGFECEGTLRSARDLVELYFEIEDYSAWAADNAHQFERLRRILARFGNFDLRHGQDRPAIEPPIVFLEQHLTLFELKISRYHDLVYRKRDAAFFNGVRQEVLRRLDAHVLPLFRETFLGALTVPLSGRERRAERSDAKIRQLVKFAEQRNLANQFTYTYTLESALSLPWGAYYLKRFARKRLQEESVLFVLETDAFRLLEAHAKVDKTPEDTALLRRRVKRICELYVSDAAPLQVNISHAQRNAVLHRALADEEFAPDVFEDARDEVLRMLRLNLWPAFQHDNMHENFLRKCAHNMHRCGAELNEFAPVLQSSQANVRRLSDIPSTPSTATPSSSPTSAATSSHKSCATHNSDDAQERESDECTSAPTRAEEDQECSAAEAPATTEAPGRASSDTSSEGESHAATVVAPAATVRTPDDVDLAVHDDDASVQDGDATVHQDNADSASAALPIGSKTVVEAGSPAARPQSGVDAPQLGMPANNGGEEVPAAVVQGA